MMVYKTLKEKADEWDVSIRHLQYLCKKGRIEGAVKKAGTWFIPDSAITPAQYAKYKNGHFDFTGTKKRIFDCAVKLFQASGFEAVSMKDISDAVGITQSSLYNHFKSKDEILDTIYDFYRCYFLKDRPELKDLEPILQNGTPLDIIQSVSYQFDDSYLVILTEITTIIFHRCAIDDRAKELSKSLMIDEGVRYVREVLDRAVELGRLAPVDTHTLALLINSIRIFTLHSWVVDPSLENAKRIKEDELKLYQHVAKLMPDLGSAGR